MAYQLENIAILSAKRATFRCILWGFSRNEGLRRLNSSVLEDKNVLYMDFGANKTPIEVIRAARQEVLILETFILVLMGSGAKNCGKNLISYKILITSINAQNIMMSVSINMVLNTGRQAG